LLELESLQGQVAEELVVAGDSYDEEEILQLSVQVEIALLSLIVPRRYAVNFSEHQKCCAEAKQYSDHRHPRGTP